MINADLFLKCEVFWANHTLDKTQANYNPVFKILIFSNDLHGQ